MEKSLYEKVNADFMLAFKSKETEKKNFLGLIKGEISNESSRGKELNDELVLSVIKKMEKSLLQTNTPESLKELEYIKCYLPKMMNEEDVIKIVKDLISKDFNNIGMVMGYFNKNHKGMVDNKMVSQVAKKFL